MALIPLLRVNLLDQSSSPNFPIAITMPENSTLAETDAETQKVESLIRGVPGITAYQATVGGMSDPFAPPGTVPADPTQASVLVLVSNGQYDTALAGVTQRAATATAGRPRSRSARPRTAPTRAAARCRSTFSATDPGHAADANDLVLAALVERARAWPS